MPVKVGEVKNKMIFIRRSNSVNPKNPYMKFAYNSAT